LIILDEPTIGLDPHQIRAVRSLIKDLGREQTVLLSSHILPEIEMTCSRVLILFEGRIVAADTAENLRQRLSSGGKVVAELSAPAEELSDCLAGMAEVEDYELEPVETGFTRCTVTPREGIDLRAPLFELAVSRGWKLRELTHQRLSLEDIFMRLTRGDHEAEES
jgi:ABC-2 type transport system ATP-binding protein